MPHLAIECSSLACSVSLLDRAKVIQSLALDGKTGSLQGLALLIQNILSPKSDVVAPPFLLSVTAGPGSFTGLRVGLATAKSLAYAWDIPVIPVDTLHAIALRTAKEFSMEGREYWLVTVMNAFRKQVFAAAWQVDAKGLLTRRKCSQVVDAAQWIADPWESLAVPIVNKFRDHLGSDNPTIRISGPGLKCYRPAESERSSIVDSQLWEPRSVEVGEIGWEKFSRGEISNSLTLAANYLRQSAAEEFKRTRDSS